ncbi:MAG: hypothetical protein IJS26_04735 [Alphaproteobacteria bacterium]|nr:hypothetical protein [Alphaproteobacteria bacterium]
MQRDIKVGDIRKALSILSQNDLGKKILSDCQNVNFDVSEIAIMPSDGRRGARCFRQIDGKKIKDFVSVNETLLQNEVFDSISADDEKWQMLANLLAHELTHASQYGRNPTLIPVENSFTQNMIDKKRDIIHEAIMESLIEADCRAVQFMLAISSQSPAVLKTLEKQHIPSNGIPIIDKKNYMIWKLRHKSDNKIDDSKRQNAFREIFRNILTSYVDVYEKHIFPKNGIAQKIDFNGHEKLLASIYDEQKYGSPRQFADVIPDLRDENKTVLVGTILSQTQKLLPQHTIQVSSLKENIPVTNIRISRVLE